jgi:excisionase family DNA binding protein
MRELGDLAPVRGVVEWLREQSESIAAPPESVRLIGQIERRLTDAIAAAQHADLEEGVTVQEYARLTDTNPDAIYKRIKRGQLPAKRIGRDIRIPVESAAA